MAHCGGFREGFVFEKSAYLNTTVLVTGASGFIGGLVCRELVAQGATVHSISRNLQKTDDKINWWLGDLADIGFVRSVFDRSKPNIVIHLASEVTGKRELENVLPTLHGNLVSAANLLVCATDYGCERIVLAGSLEEPDENDVNPVPCSPYAAAKWASSAYARMFYALYKTPVVIARLYMVYGPHQKDLRKLIPYVSLALTKKEVPQLASGGREVDWIYVDDVVRGLVLMGVTPGIENTTIDLGTGELFTTGYVAEQLCKVSGVGINPIYGALSERPMERVKKADILRTNELLKWAPKTKLIDGLEKTFRWYEQQYQSGNIR